MIPLIRVSGAPFEMGKEIGQKARKFIRAGASFYRRHWKQMTDLSWQKSVALLGPSQKMTRALLPKTFAELEGMARGSGVTFNTLFVINSMEALEHLKPKRERCTTLIIHPKRTKNHHLLLAHNEDWIWQDQKWLYVIHGKPVNEPEFLSLTYGAWVPQYGLNAAGIAFAADSQTATDARPGLSQTLIGREVLRARSIKGTIKRIRELPQAAGHTYLIASPKTGFALETTARVSQIIKLKDSIVHTNFYQTAACAPFEKGKRTYSRFRYFRTRELLEKSTNITRDKLFDILGDHENFPESVCNHTAEIKKRPWEEQTIARMIIDPQALTIDISNAHGSSQSFAL